MVQLLQMLVPGSFDYSWNSSPVQTTQTATGLAAGTYIVTVTDATTGCADTAHVTILDSNPPIANAGTDATICNGGNTTLNGTATGGVSPYTFSWAPAGSLTDPNIANPIASPTTTTTYTLTVTDFNGCQSTDQVIITVNPLPAVTVTSTLNTICLGANATLTASGASNYTWSPSTGLSATSGPSVVATPSVTTTYTVNGTDANGCQSSAQITITVNPLPNVSIDPPTGAICVGETIVLTASGATDYTWTPATGLNTTNGAVVEASPTETTTYIVTGSNGTCSNSDTVIVTVTPLPVVTVTPSNPAICLGSSTTLTASGASTYTWSPATGLSSTTDASVTANPTTTTTYTVTGTGAGGCQNSTNVTVTVNPLPTVTINPSAPVICVGDSVTLTASGAVTYSWSPATALSSTGTAVTIANPSVTTTYTVTGTDAIGCQNTATVTVTVNSLPVITVNPPSANVCQGTTTELTASGATNYTWTPATGLNTTNGAVVEATPTTTTTYTVTGTDGNACTSSATVTITVRPIPTITVSPSNPTICSGDSVILTASGAVTYSWSPSTGLSSSIGTSVTATPNTTTTYTVIGTAANGCTNTRTVTVTVRDLPVVTVSPLNPVICEGGSETLQAGGASTYTWNPTTGLSPTSGANVTATPSTTTTYTVTGTDASGCRNTASTTVTVNPNPVLTASSTNALCGADDGTATVNHGAGTYTYSWNTSPVQTTQTATGLSAGTYTVLVTNTATSCFDTISVEVLNPTGPTVNAGLNDTICIGSSINLNGTITDGEPPYVFAWTPAATLTGANTLTPTATPTVTTTYTLTATDDNNCTTTDQVTIVVNNPEALTSTDDTICLGESTTLIATGGIIYTWTPAAGLNTTTNDTVIATPTVTTTYYVTVQDNIGCTDSDSIKVTVLSLPNVAINASKTDLCLGDSTVLTASGAVSYTWSPSTGLNNTVGNIVIANPTTDITYVVVGIGANGCAATDSVFIKVNQLPIVTIDANDTVLCNGTFTTLTANGALNYTWSPATGLSGTTGSVVTANPLTDITYTVVGEDANGCTASADIDITVNPIPTISITPVSAEICLGDTTQISASGAVNYFWSPAVGINPTTGPIVDAFPTITTTYQVIGTDANGCADTAFVTVTVNQLPVVTASTSDSIICAGDSTVLFANGALTYEWVPSSSLSSPTGTPVVAQPTVTTNYLVIGTDANGCKDRDTVSIIVIPQPIISITPTNDSLCFGSSVDLTASGADNYTWSPAGTLSGTTGTTVTATPTTTITYFVSGADANGCVGDTSILITVLPNPIVTALPSNPIICIGDTVILTANGASTYIWSPSTFLLSTTGAVVLAVPTSDITYTVTGFDAFGCSDTAMVNLYVNPLPTISITASDTVICSGDTITMTASGGISYVWSPNISISSTTGNTVEAYPTSTITYYVSGFDANSCTNRDSVTITVNPLPFVDFDGLVTPICLNSDPITLTGIPNGGTFSGSGISGNTFTPAVAGLGGPHPITYTFTDANGCTNDTTKEVTVNPVPEVSVSSLLSSYCQNFGVVILEGTPVGGTFTVDGVVSTFFNTNDLTVGNHTVVYIFTDGNGCSDDTTLTFTIHPLPTVSFNGLNNSYCLDASSSTLTGNPAGGTFSGNGITGNVFDPSLAGAGTHTITYSFTDGNGCTNTDTQNVTVNPLPNASFTGLDTLYCVNENDALLTGFPVGGTFSGTGISGNIFSPATAGIGNHTITYTFTDANGCTGTFTRDTRVVGLPNVTATNIQNVTCFGDINGSVQLNGSAGTPTYTFSLDGVTFTVINTYTDLTAGNYTGYITDFNGCINTTNFTITEPDSISAIFTTINPLNCTDSTGTIEITNITGGTPGYQTSLNGGAFTATFTYTNLSSGNPLVIIRDANGCEKTYNTAIFSPESIMASDSSTNILCFGDNNGMVMVYNISGSVKPYEFSLDNITYGTDSVFTGLTPGIYTIYIKGADGCLSQFNFNITEPSELILTLPSKTDILCFGETSGEVIANATGGTSSYLFTLNGGTTQATGVYSGLAAGNYNLVVTDANGCTKDLNFTITQPDSISASFSTVDPVICSVNDGVISLFDITGGIRPLLFSIDFGATQSDSTFTGLFSGNHIITIIDANGCSKNLSIDLTSPSDIEATVTPTDILCFGNTNGTITVSGVSGGVSPYVYSLTNSSYTSNNVFTGLSAGNYTVYIRDADLCISTYTVSIAEPTELNATVTDLANIRCFGDDNGTATITVSGGTPGYQYSTDGFSYTSTNIFTNLDEENYLVFVKDTNGCFTFTSFSITEPDQLIAEISLVQQPDCKNPTSGTVEFVNVSGGTNPIRYSTDGVTFQNSPLFENLEAGNYNFIVIDTNGCFLEFPIEIINSDTIDASIVTSDINCGGANTGTAEITVNSGGTQPFVYSVNGVNYQSTSSFSGLSAGSYVAFVKDADSCIFNIPFEITESEILNADVAILNPILCFGDNSAVLEINASGGVAAYQFSIDGINYQSDSIFSDLSALTDTAYVQDANGCIVKIPFEITQPDTFKVEISVGNLVCYNDSNLTFTISATGGTPTYQYSINGGVNFLTDSIFSGINQYNDTIIVMDANGCRFDTAFVITRPDSIKGIITNTTVASCESTTGELILSNITGGTAPYQISIDGGAFGNDTIFANLSAGSHTITIIDANGCIANLDGSVDQFGGLFNADIVIVPNLCPREEVAQIRFENISGQAPPYRFSIADNVFQLDSNFINLSWGGYLPQVLDANNCLFTFDSVKFAYIDTILTEIIHLENTLPRDSTGEFTLGNTTGATPFIDDSGNPFYLYSISDISPDSLYSTNSVYTDLKEGTYPVYIKDSRGCIDSIFVNIGRIVITPPLFIPNIFTPNGDGTNDFFVIRMLPPNSRLEIVNRWGNRVYRTDNYQNDWDGGKMDDGVYYYYLELENGLKFKGWVEINSKQ
jgi:gliding motility-associated-like protein